MSSINYTARLLLAAIVPMNQPVNPRRCAAGVSSPTVGVWPVIAASRSLASVWSASVGAELWPLRPTCGATSPSSRPYSGQRRLRWLAIIKSLTRLFGGVERAAVSASSGKLGLVNTGQRRIALLLTLLTFWPPVKPSVGELELRRVVRELIASIAHRAGEMP